MDKVILFDTDTCSTAREFERLEPTVLRESGQVEEAFAEEAQDALWIALHPQPLLRALAGLSAPHRLLSRLLVLDQGGEPDFFWSFFERVVVAKNGFLPLDQLAEVLSTSDARDLFIGGRVDPEAEVLLLFRGDLSPLIAPLQIFRPVEGEPKPDPREFAIEDYGQTVRLGDYEAAADAILYELDPDYRRRMKRRRREEEQSFGASLRRPRR